MVAKIATDRCWVYLKSMNIVYQNDVDKINVGYKAYSVSWTA